MFLYNLAITTYSLIVRIAANKSDKAKLWCEGRIDLFERMSSAIEPDDRVIWIHVASLGEFEQGRPIIERIREEHPEYKILLTFFSPSGYEVRKNYTGADYIFYLPIDTTRNARRFLDIAHPEIAIFVKYEYWLNLLFELRNRKIRSYIVSAIFRRNSIFFKSWGSMWRRALVSFETLFVQDHASQKMLAELGFDNVVVAGDTRFDRVVSIAKGARTIPEIEWFKGKSRALVAGSTWQPDEELLLKLAENHKDIKFIFAPHEIGESRVKELMQRAGARAVRYTEVMRLSEEAQREKLNEAQILVVDTIGMLSSLYKYGDFGYIGGGFGVGIHNTLEAAVFGLPLAFGTNYQRFKEANDLIALGAFRSISNAEELEAWFSALQGDTDLYTKAAKAAKHYTTNMSGATQLITQTIFCE